MAYDGPALPTGPVFNYTLQTQPAGYSSVTFGSMVATHEMHPAGFRDKVAALVEAYEELVAVSANPRIYEDGSEERARAVVDTLRAELGL